MQPVRIYIANDDSPENPSDNDGWKVFSFNPRHASYQNPNTFLTGELDADGKPEIHDEDLRKKMDAGLAFFLSYYEHGPCVWALLDQAPKCRFDGTRFAGVLIWGQPEADIGAKDPGARALDAGGFLDTYTKWCNGYVYGYNVDDPEGKIDAGCWGFYDLDQMFHEIKEAVGDREVTWEGPAKDLVEHHWPPKEVKQDAE